MSNIYFHLEDKSLPKPEALQHVRDKQTLVELILLTDHYNGYIRQQALVECQRFHDKQVFYVAFRCLNDWVAKVHQLAVQTVLHLEPLLTLADWVALIPELEIVQRYGRYKEALASLIQTLEERIMAREGAEEALVAAVVQGIAWTARPCYRILLRYSQRSMPQLLDIAWQAQDIVCARLALKACQAYPSTERAPWMITALEKIRFADVRARLVRALQQDLTSEAAISLNHRLLLDPQKTVRAIAMFHLQQEGVDLYAYYLAQLSHTPKIALEALSSLPVVSVENVFSLIQPYTQHSNPAVRRAAYHAWFVILPEQRDQTIQHILQDAKLSVRFLAYQLQIKHRAYVGLTDILNLLPHPDNVRLALALVKKNCWQHLEVLLHLAVQEDDFFIQPVDWTAEIIQFVLRRNRQFLPLPASVRGLLQDTRYSTALRARSQPLQHAYISYVQRNYYHEFWSIFVQEGLAFEF